MSDDAAPVRVAASAGTGDRHRMIAAADPFLRPYVRLAVVMRWSRSRPSPPLPARPQRRHHQQRRRQGRHRLHPPDRRPSCCGVTLVLAIAAIIAVYWGSKTAMALRPRRARRDLPPGRELLAGRGQPLRHAVADHAQHQRRAAGADGRADDAQRHDLGADHGDRRHHHGAAPGRAALGRAPGRSCRSWWSSSASCCPRAMPLFRAMQVKIDRINQVMRETLSRHARHPRLRAHRPRGAALRRRQPRPHRRPRSRSNRLFALMIPTLMRDPEPLDRRDHVVRRPSGSTSGGMPIGNLTAFLTYIMQILLSVMMATIMFVMVPRAAASAERIQEVLDTRAVGRRPGRAASPLPRGARPRRVPRRRVPLPGRRGRRCCAASRSRPARARRRPSSAAPAAASRRSSTSSRASTTSPAGSVLVDGVDVREMRPGGPLGAHRARAAEGVPVQRHRGEQPALRRRATPPTRSSGSALEIAQGRGVRRGDAGAARGADRRRAAPTSRAASASGSPSPGRWSSGREIYVFDDSFSALDFTTDARLRAALKRGDRATPR